MHSHRIDVLDRANDHAIVVFVPNDFEFVFLPTSDGTLDENFADWRRGKADFSDLAKVSFVVSNSGPGASEDVRGTDDDRESDGPDDLHRARFTLRAGRIKCVSEA